MAAILAQAGFKQLLEFNQLLNEISSILVYCQTWHKLSVGKSALYAKITLKIEFALIWFTFFDIFLLAQ